MKERNPILNENQLMELMAGISDAKKPAISTAEKETENPFSETNTPKKEIAKKKKTDTSLYENRFFQQGQTSAREGKSVYIRAEFHQRIARIVQVIGEDKISIYTYLDNVLQAHFEQYQEEIIQSFHQKYKPIF